MKKQIYEKYLTKTEDIVLTEEIEKLNYWEVFKKGTSEMVGIMTYSNFSSYIKEARSLGLLGEDTSLSRGR